MGCGNSKEAKDTTKIKKKKEESEEEEDEPSESVSEYTIDDEDMNYKPNYE